MKQKQFTAYIMASKPRGTFYHGAPGNLPIRSAQNAGEIPGGAAHALKYRTYILAYFELYDSWEEAHARELALKHWKRDWKIELIENSNPDWRDLRQDLINILPMAAL